MEAPQRHSLRITHPADAGEPALRDAAAQLADATIDVARRVGSAAAVAWLAIHRMTAPTGIARITCQELAGRLSRFGAKSPTPEAARLWVEALVRAGFVHRVDKSEGHVGGLEFRPLQPADIERLLSGEPHVVDGDAQGELPLESNSKSNPSSSWSCGGERGAPPSPSPQSAAPKRSSSSLPSEGEGKIEVEGEDHLRAALEGTGGTPDDPELWHAALDRCRRAVAKHGGRNLEPARDDNQDLFLKSAALVESEKISEQRFESACNYVRGVAKFRTGPFQAFKFILTKELAEQDGIGRDVFHALLKSLTIPPAMRYRAAWPRAPPRPA